MLKKLKKTVSMLMAPLVATALCFAAQNALGVDTTQPATSEPPQWVPLEPVKDSKTSSNQNPDIDDQAAKILRDALDYLTSLKKFHLRANAVTDVVQDSGQKLQFGSTLAVNVRRPNRFQGTYTRDNGTQRHSWYNGKIATIYEKSENAYAQIPVPDTIDEALDYLETIIEAPQPLADLLYSDLSYIEEGYQAAMDIGPSKLAEKDCDHLAFRGESVDWQVWVEQGEKPVIRKFLITYKELPGQPQFTANLDQWDVSPELPDNLFEFVAPEGAQRIKVVLSRQRNEDKRGN
jgi:hypothetical protein